MKWSLLFLLLVALTIEAKASEINTLLSVQRVDLSNKGMPIKGTLSSKRITYRLINNETSTTEIIHQRGKASALNLEPGSYCFRSWRVADIQWVKVINPICFVVKKEGIVNAGTWVVGIKVSNQEWYAKIVDIKENYKDVQTILEIDNSVPASMHMPNNK